jgi:hypothetical protein
MDDEIELVAQQMYRDCYIGHLTWEQWRKFAAFCIEYHRANSTESRFTPDNDGPMFNADH